MEDRQEENKVSEDIVSDEKKLSVDMGSSVQEISETDSSVKGTNEEQINELIARAENDSREEPTEE